MGKLFNVIEENLATEAIDFQNDGSGKQLVALYQKVIDTIEDDPSIRKRTIEEIGHKKKIEDFLFNRFGIKINLIFDTDTYACVPLYLTKYHVLMDSMWHGDFTIRDQDRFMRDKSGSKGTIDLKNAKVTGIFSEYKHVLLMDVKSAVNKFDMTAEELAGITLHEVGHLFTMMELSNRLQTTNQVLQSVSEGLKNGDSIKKYEHIFIEIGNDYKIPRDKINDILESHHHFVIGAKLYNALIGACGEQIRGDYYHRTAGEQVADQFSNRFGLGHGTVTGLQKLHEYYGSPDVDAGARAGMLFNDICLMVMGCIGAIALFTPAGILVGLFMVGINVLVTLLSGDAYSDFTYDKLRDRYKRIRQDMVRQLTDSNLDRETMKEVIENIKIVDKTMEKAVNYRSIFSVIGNVIFPSNRKAVKDHEVQQTLESIVNNNMFVKSAELKILTGV